MEPPSIKLTILQGPREGETLDFLPGSTIRLGRLVRGNNVTIKDEGISSKHLLILEESGKWTIQDLGSSNGTVLNSVNMPPLIFFNLRDGDTIKLGEWTSILVNIYVGGGTESRVSRYPKRRRGGGDVRVSTESLEENADCVKNDDALEENVKRGRPRKGKVLTSITEKEELGNAVRVRQSRRNKEHPVVVENPHVEVSKIEVEVKGKRTRGRRKVLEKLPTEEVEDDEKGDELDLQEGPNEIKNVGVETNNNDDVKGRQMGRRLKVLDELPTRDSKDEKGEESNPLKLCNEAENVGAGAKNGDELKGKQIGKMRKVLEEFPGKGSEDGEEGAELPAKENENDAKGEEGAELPTEENEDEVKGEELDAHKSCYDTQNYCFDANNKGAKMAIEANENLGDGERKFPDFEEMTLGEWFAFMEVQFPKQIIDATEEMIEEMRKRAKQVEEYMKQQKENKGVITVS